MIALSDMTPVILIGAARSGTKFLRDTISQDPKFAKVPYDINFVWRGVKPNHPDDAFKAQWLTQKKSELMRDRILRLAKLPDGEKRLIEKSVSNGLRIEFVNAVFPDAKFIHLVRDGRSVVESAFRMWNTNPNLGNLFQKVRDLRPSEWGYVFWFARNYFNGLLNKRSGGEVWGPRYIGIESDIESISIERVVAKQWSSCVEMADKGLAKIAKDRVITIRYEDIGSDLTQRMQLAEFLDVDDPKQFCERLANQFDTKYLNSWEANISDDLLDAVILEGESVLKRFGYLEGNQTK